MENVNVVFSSDNQYVQHLIVTLTSMLENTKHAEDITVNIIDGGIDQENKLFLTKLTHHYGTEINFFEINREIIKNAVVNGHITEATYYRILIPTLFDNSVSKVIYLDCDLVIRHDIYHLWKLDIGSFSLGAVKINEYNLHERLGIPRSSSYFNAGVLIINIFEWKKKNIVERIMEFIAQYPERLMMWDQDALNGILHDDWYEIESTWNLRSQIFEIDYAAAGFESEVDFERLKADPAILHFTTASKPWHYLNIHPHKEEYFTYLDISGFTYVKFPEKEFILSSDIVIFGTGKKAEITAEKLEKKSFNVTYYVDNNDKKWNDEFLGKEIKSPACLTTSPNSIFIIIASQYSAEIAEQLINMGLKENCHFIRSLD